MDKLIFVTRATQKSGKGHFLRVIRMVEKIKHICNCTIVVDMDAAVGFETLKFHPYNISCPESLIYELGLDKNDIIWFDVPDSEYSIIESFQGKNIPLVSTNMFDKLGDERYEDVAIYPVFETCKRVIVGNKTLQLSGSEFVSLPEDFFFDGSEKFPYVLVSMGGTDPMQFTPLVLNAIYRIKNSPFIYKVILPKGTKKEGVIAKYINCKHLELYDFGSLSFPLMLKKAKYAIINGGMTRYECVAAKVFFIALSIHEKQYELTEKVTRYGYGKNFGLFNEACISRLMSLLDNLPIEPSFNICAESTPELRVNGAKWVYEKVIKELRHEDE
uniref:Uncharacterized protein n=1 Tax=Shewanella sp. (strain MR-7) TaxID=60481 RepID=Q0HWW7_SHESR